MYVGSERAVTCYQDRSVAVATPQLNDDSIDTLDGLPVFRTNGGPAPRM